MPIAMGPLKIVGHLALVYCIFVLFVLAMGIASERGPAGLVTVTNGSSGPRDRNGVDQRGVGCAYASTVRFSARPTARTRRVRTKNAGNTIRIKATH